MRSRAALLLGVLTLAGWTAGCMEAGFSRGEDPCPSSAQGVLTGTWGPGGFSSGFVTGSDYLWQPTSLEDGGGGFDAEACLPRLVELDATLTWENTLEASGDLALAAGPAPQEPSVIADRTREAAPGEHRQEMRLAEGDLEDAGLRGAARIYVGPASATGYYGPTGLPYTLDLVLRFAPLPDAGAGGGSFGGGGPGGGGGDGLSVPGPAVPLVLGGLGIVVRVLADRVRKP